MERVCRAVRLCRELRAPAADPHWGRGRRGGLHAAGLFDPAATNWFGLQEPNGGPTFYPWATDANYDINIDTDGTVEFVYSIATRAAENSSDAPSVARFVDTNASESVTTADFSCARAPLLDSTTYGATDARSAAFEAAQEECGEGPCVDSLVLDVVVSTDDLGADPRWPQLFEEERVLIQGALGDRGLQEQARSEHRNRQEAFALYQR